MNILLVAYYFPPDSSSGSFRPLFFANHLVGAGDDVTVLTARREDFLAEQTVDPELLATLDPRVTVERCRVRRPKERLIALRNRLTGRTGSAGTAGGRPDRAGGPQEGSQAFKDLVTDLLTTPDVHAGWIVACVRKGAEVIRRRRPDFILATGGPWSGLVAGAILKRLTGVPLALDFRDPWVSNPDQTRRGSLCRWLDARLERAVVSNADLLIANTEELRHDFLRRYPALPGTRATAITNGFEEYLPAVPRQQGAPFTLTHAGALYFSRNPRPLLEAARGAIERGRIDARLFRLRFVGGVAVDDPDVARLLSSPELAPCVEVIQRVPYDEALRAMGDSDALVLYQPGFPLQVPRKLYDYMAARRQVLCIAEPGSATWSLVERYGLGSVCGNDPVMLEEALAAMYGAWLCGRLAPLDGNQCAPFLNRNLADRLRRSLDAALRSTEPAWGSAVATSGTGKTGGHEINV